MIPESIRRAVCEVIITSLRSGKFQTFLDMQEVNVTEFDADGTIFKFQDKEQKWPLPDNAWVLVSYLSSLYWSNPAFKVVGRV